MGKSMFHSLAAIGMTAILAASAAASPITPFNNDYDGTVRDIDNATSDIDGMGDNVTTTSMGVGDYEATNREVQRGVMIFSLPDLPSGQTVGSAMLEIYLSSIAGTPAGDAVLYHLTDDNNPGGSGIVSGDFQATPATFLGSVVSSGSSTKTTYTIDVTDAILADYASDSADGRYATFRLQIDGLSNVNENGSQDRYLFGDTGNGHPAQLTLALIPAPEPAGMALLSLIGGIALGIRRGGGRR